MTQLIIIGGGIAGLSAAYYAQQQNLTYTLLEKSSRLGGLLHTQQVDGMTIEFGPDAFITRKPWAWELAHDIGLGADIIGVNDIPERIHVLSNGDLVPLPDGVNLLVPTKLMPFLQSPLMTWRGKLRALMDVFIPPRKDDSDESLSNFITRRMGYEALDKLADPLLAGVFNADMDKQSILASFPQYRKLEAEYGSLIRGMWQQSKRPKPTTSKPALMSFKGGIQQFIDTLADQLTGALRCDAPVTHIGKDDDDNYTVIINDEETLTAPTLIMATPATISSGLLRDVLPMTANELGKIRYAGVGNQSFAFHKRDVPRKLDAYGIVIPSSEKRNIDGMQWSNAKWRYRAPDDVALIRCFFGGPHTREMLDHDDEQLTQLVREELRDIMGITAEPIYKTEPQRLKNAYPQYDVGHLETVADIMKTLPDTVRVTGNAYNGVGVPDTIRTSKQAARDIANALQVDKTE